VPPGGELAGEAKRTYGASPEPRACADS
jgi:hypothetical protein